MWSNTKWTINIVFRGANGEKSNLVSSGSSCERFFTSHGNSGYGCSSIHNTHTTTHHNRGQLRPRSVLSSRTRTEPNPPQREFENKRGYYWFDIRRKMTARTRSTRSHASGRNFRNSPGIHSKHEGIKRHPIDLMLKGTHALTLTSEALAQCSDLIDAPHREVMMGLQSKLASDPSPSTSAHWNPPCIQVSSNAVDSLQDGLFITDKVIDLGCSW